MIESTEVGELSVTSPSAQPAAARTWKRPSALSSRSIETFAKRSALRMPSHTDSRIESIERDSVRPADTRRRCSSDSRCPAARCVSCALSTASAACAATATSTSSSASLGVRPPAGSSTEMIPSVLPSARRSGTSSASSGCQAPGSLLASMSGTKLAPSIEVQSNSLWGMKYAPPL